MSALTDKIEALMTQAQQAERPGQTNAPMGDIWPLLGDILADVRELERINGDNWTANRKLMARQDTCIRQAKREAYEHALAILNKSMSGTGWRKQMNICNSIQNAIDALNTEGDAK